MIEIPDTSPKYFLISKIYMNSCLKVHNPTKGMTLFFKFLNQFSGWVKETWGTMCQFC